MQSQTRLNVGTTSNNNHCCLQPHKMNFWILLLLHGGTEFVEQLVMKLPSALLGVLLKVFQCIHNRTLSSLWYIPSNPHSSFSKGSIGNTVNLVLDLVTSGDSNVVRCTFVCLKLVLTTNSPKSTAISSSLTRFAISISYDHLVIITFKQV